MPDWTTSGPTFETPIDAANEIYASTPPTFGAVMKDMALQSSRMLPIVGEAERGLYTGASPYDVGLAQEFADEGYAPGVGALPPQGGSIPTPILAPAEYNQKYAPLGPDGKKVSLGDAPMPEGVAKLLGQEKADQIDRESVISRFQNAHSWPVNLGTGIAAFLMDPMNLATSFIPGVGEESVATRLGGGFLARTAGRVTAGGAAGAIAQAPLTAVSYGASREDLSDYSLRDAFRDLVYSAAGGAIFHAGLGSLGDIIGKKAPLAPPEAKPILEAPASVKYDAMKTAVAQIVDGRPVDVLPVFSAHDISLLSQEAQLRERGTQLDTFLSNLQVHPNAQNAAETLARIGEVERQLANPETSAEDIKTLNNRRDELLANTIPETLREQAASAELKRQAESERANVNEQIANIAAKRTVSEASAALSPYPKFAPSPADVATYQENLQRNGYSQSLDQPTYDKVMQDTYGTPADPRIIPTTAEEDTAVNRQYDATMKDFQARGIQLLPDEQAIMDRTNADLQRADAIEEGGGCFA